MLTLAWRLALAFFPLTGTTAEVVDLAAGFLLLALPGALVVVGAVFLVVVTIFLVVVLAFLVGAALDDPAVLEAATVEGALPVT